MDSLNVIQDPTQIKIHQQPGKFSGGTLRDYQLEGFRWICIRHFFGESMILADEMGLGKTIQVIAYLAWLREHFSEDDTHVLIVCPLSTLGNWVDELRRFTPSLSVLRYHGTQEEREALREQYIYPYRDSIKHQNRRHSSSGGDNETTSVTTPTKNSDRKKSTVKKSIPAHHLPIIVTTYEVAARDYEELTTGIHWRSLIIDEGHRLKNEAGVTRRLLQEYSKQTIKGEQIRILLTGTPVQNDMIELWSLCNFIMPSIFKSKDEFKKIYSFVGMGTSAGTDYLRTQEQRNAIISKLHGLLSRYLLRRTKREVKLDLPPKVEALIYTPLTSVQMRLLRALKTGTVEPELNKMGWVIREDTNKIAHISGLNAQMNLRKICVHPYFFAEPPPNYRTGEATDERIISSCGKMIILDKMLRKLRAKGHKVLIFSQFKTMIDILADYFEFVGKQTLGEYRIITGGTDSLDRDAAIREFNHDPENKIFAFLLSTKAGGLGINLVAADTVIFYDSDWNPKGDEQAQDRAHRIGQIRAVVVYRFITEGASVERRMLRIAAGKSSLGRVVLQEGKFLLSNKKEKPGGTTPTSSGGTPRSKKVDLFSVNHGDSESEEDDTEKSYIDKTTGLSRYGKCSEKLLDYWLRNELDESAAVMRGISDREVYTILDRARALQAGKRVADNVEAQLLLEEGTNQATNKDNNQPSTSTVNNTVNQRSSPQGSSPLTTTTVLTSTSASISATKSPNKRSRGQTAETGNGTPNKTGGDSVIQNHLLTASPVRPRRGTPQQRSTTVSLPPVAQTTLDSNHKGSIEKELSHWEKIAEEAEYTPSKGDGYEFVYHQASRGLLPSTAAMDQTNETTNTTLQSDRNVAELAKAVAKAGETVPLPTEEEFTVSLHPLPKKAKKKSAAAAQKAKEAKKAAIARRKRLLGKDSEEDEEAEYDDELHGDGVSEDEELSSDIENVTDNELQGTKRKFTKRR